MRRLLLVCIALAGCGRSFDAHDIELTIAVAPGVSDRERATVQTLDVAVTGDAQATMSYRLDRPLASSEKVVVHFTAASGHVTISGLARDAQRLIVMRGHSDAVDLGAGGAHTANVTLSPLPGGQHIATAINLLPSSYTLFTGQSLQLATDGEMVTWSSSDAMVDASGRFTAPATAGTYHALARSALYPTDEGTVTLEVLASGIARYAGDAGGVGTVDGTGSAARINSPYAMVRDPSGIVYFTDNGGAVRKLDPATGAVTTIAGSPDHFDVADGSGAAAAFRLPAGLASDGAGTLYVADVQCPCIRAVQIATGAVTTLAGKRDQYGSMDGVGAAATFRQPNALAYDAAKKVLYVSDDTTHTVRRIDVTTATVSTFAGVPDTAGSQDGPAASATFDKASHIVLDGNALFINDWGHHNIRKLDLGTMMVSTLTSNVDFPTMTASGNGTLVLTATLRTVDESTGAVTPIVDGAGQQMNDFLTSVLPMPDGTYLGAAIKAFNRYDLTKVVDGGTGRAVVAGYWVDWRESDGPRATARLSSFGSFVVRSDGVIFGKDNRVIRIDPDGTVSTVTPWRDGPQIIDGLGAMAFGADGMLYAVDWNQQTLKRVDVDHGGGVTTVAGKAGSPGYADGVGSAAQFNGVESVAADGNKLYVTEINNDAVRAVDPSTGTVTTLAGGGGCGYADMPGTMARFCGLRGIVADGAGALYVTANNAVRKIVIATGAVSTFAGDTNVGFADGPAATARFSDPQGLTIDPAKKYLYVADANNDAIRRVELATGAVSTVAGGPGKAQVVEGALPGAINQPSRALGFLPTGELLVAVPREESLLQIRLP